MGRAADRSEMLVLVIHGLVAATVCLIAFAVGRTRSATSHPHWPLAPVAFAISVGVAVAIWAAIRNDVAVHWRVLAAVVGGLAVAVPLLAFHALARRRDLPLTDILPLLALGVGFTLAGGLFAAVFVSLLTQCDHGCVDVR